ncbi:MAG: glycoside hydrolase family 99-like domain-containing protein [Defluviitaleaceae bacterium]|nr:glycoside hydrolase family 99-like domain-containing protein [Defluviitaleaceae bacterium]
MNDKLINQQVFIMPFTPKSILLYYLLVDNGVEVVGFCDNANALAAKKFKNTPIFPPQEAYNINPNAFVLLSEDRFFDINGKQLAEIGFKKTLTITKLDFNDKLKSYIPKMDVSYYSKLIPNQVEYGKAIIKILNDVNNWKDFLASLDIEYPTPYHYKIPDAPFVVGTQQNINFLLCVNATGYFNMEFLLQCLDSIENQNYPLFSYLFLISADNQKELQKTLHLRNLNNTILITSPCHVNNINAVDVLRNQFSGCIHYDFIITVGANDKLANNALFILANEIVNNKNSLLFTANEDREYNGDFIAPYYKRDYKQLHYMTAAGLCKNFVCIRANIKSSINEMNTDDIHIVDEVLYHYKVISSSQNNNEIKIIAFYLPQFYPFPENDRWWGTGFTEWTNTKRAIPMYEGHYQPHEPGALGYYDLIKDKDVQRKQAELAKKHGIYGFCYYYMWFGGKRLLEKPLFKMLNDPKIDIPFCIMWCNESWSRRWDSRENEVLIANIHDDESDRQFILDALPILRDERYITISGAPLLIIYRIDQFPDFKKTVALWRQIAAENGIKKLHISVALHAWAIFDDVTSYGCDSTTEFPPHRNPTTDITKKMNLNHGFNGKIFDYVEYVRRAMNRHRFKHRRFRGAMQSFDNTARRMENAFIFHGSTPEEYKKLIISLVDYTSRQPKEDKIIFINAWNEWAEGNHLEPDMKYGEAYLQATLDALHINC